MSNEKKSGVLTEAMFSLFELERTLDLDIERLASVYVHRLNWLWEDHKEELEAKGIKRIPAEED